MTITLAVKNMAAQVGRDTPTFVAGRLWVDAVGAKLFDWDSDESVPFLDDEACSAVRAAVPPPGEYLGGAMMQVWVRAGRDGPELHKAYWILLGNLEDDPPSKWGPRLAIRPVPPEFDFVR